MLNIARLKVGDIVRILIDKNGFALKAGDTLRVVQVGFSGWDGQHYADCKTDKGYTLEIMKKYKDFELVL